MTALPLRKLLGLYESVAARLSSPLSFWIAGGAVRDAVSGETPKDIDLFFPGAEHLQQAQRDLLARGCAVRYETEHSVGVVTSMGDESFDLIKTFFATAEDIVASFDFACVSAAFAPDCMALHPHFLEDVGARRLRVTTLTSPECSAMRAMRFISRGWTLPPEEALKFVQSSPDARSRVPAAERT